MKGMGFGQLHNLLIMKISNSLYTVERIGRERGRECTERGRKRERIIFFCFCCSILPSLRHFVSEISLPPASFLQEIQETSPGDGSPSISDENVFTISKCSVIIHLFEFVVAVNKSNIKLQTFWDQSFWSLVGW